jgi:hypothetical protein
MTGPENSSSDRIAAECRAAVSALATAVVLRDPSALRYLSGQTEFGDTLPASPMMLSSAYLVSDVLLSGLGTALGHRPTDAEVMQAWRPVANEARERLAASLDKLAETQIAVGMPEDEVRATIGLSARFNDAGLVTALPLLTAFLSRDMTGFLRGCVTAVARLELRPAVLATQLIVRDLFETSVNTLVGGVATDEEIKREWETFMARRAAGKRRE